MPSNPQEVNCQSNEAELFRETLQMLRLNLRSDEKAFTVIRTLYTILQNILKSPGEPKFQKLRLSNKVIQTNVCEVEESKFLLEMMGFEEKMLPTAEQVVYGNGQQVMEPFLVLKSEGAEQRSLQLVCSIIEQMLCDIKLLQAPPAATQ